VELFRLTDQFGDEIVLTDADWQRIARKHPEIEPYISEVESTLRDPDVVYEGRYTDSKVFYGKSRVTHRPFGGCYLAVVVRYSTQPASIRTAYLPEHIEASLGTLLHIKPVRG
jgi:hypothetical protein